MTTTDNKVAVSSSNKKKPPQSEFPLALSGGSLREEVLKAGGVTVDELGWCIRIGLLKAKEILNAQTSNFARYQGRLGETKQTPDNQAQLSAAKMLLELAGAFPTRTGDGGKDSGGVVIHVHLPWSGKDDAPEVIEAHGVAIPTDKAPRTT